MRRGRPLRCGFRRCPRSASSTVRSTGAIPSRGRHVWPTGLRGRSGGRPRSAYRPDLARRPVSTSRCGGFHLRRIGRRSSAPRRRASGGSSTGASSWTRRPSTPGHRACAPRPCLRGAGCRRPPCRRARRRAAWFAVGRSRRSPARRDQPSGRHRLARPHGPRATDRNPVHAADVRFPAAVPWIWVHPATHRRRHGRCRQPGSAGRGTPCRAPENVGPRSCRLPSGSAGPAWCEALTPVGRLVDRHGRCRTERTVRPG